MARSVEERIEKLAARQHGLVTRAQLLRLGIGNGAVQYRRRTRRLRPVQRGVYRIGPLVSAHEREMAAVLACGPEAVVSHRSAAALWGLLALRDDRAPVDVTVQTRGRRRRPGVLVHSSPDLGTDEVASVEAIPTTSPARTVLDVAAVLGSRRLEQVLALAEREGLTDASEVLALARRHPRRPGIHLLRTLIHADARPAMTRSTAEDRFLALIDKVELPRPEANVMVAGHEVDFLWRAERLVVEVDGFAFHASRSRFESDRLKDGRLSTRGYHVIRITWRQIVDEPEAMLVRVAQALTAAGLR